MHTEKWFDMRNRVGVAVIIGIILFDVVVFWHDRAHLRDAVVPCGPVVVEFRY